MRRSLFLSTLIFGAIALPASASAASVSISDFSNAGPGQMQATVSATGGALCPSGSTCLGVNLEGVVRPVGSTCQWPTPNDSFYYNRAFLEQIGSGTINTTYTFSPGTYKDALGVHPVPEGPIQLCAFVTATWMTGSGGIFGGAYATTVRQGYRRSNGSGAAGPSGQRVAAIKKCKKSKKNHKKKKLNKCKKS